MKNNSNTNTKKQVVFRRMRQWILLSVLVIVIAFRMSMLVFVFGFFVVSVLQNPTSWQFLIQTPYSSVSFFRNDVINPLSILPISWL